MIKPEAKLDKIIGGLKSILSVEAAVKPRGLNVCPCDISNTEKTAEIIEDILKVLDKATTEQHKQYI